MKNSFGQNVSVTIFGESHGDAIGAVIDGLPGGIEVDLDFIKEQLDKRKPYGKISTKRVEDDDFKIVSGVFEGRTTGTSICIIIPNKDTKSKDYSDIKAKARPSHADYTAHIKYNGFEDYRGGGHQSGRITAALVAAGAILINALSKKNILIGTHIKSIGNVKDSDFDSLEQDIEKLSKKQFAVLDDKREAEMVEKIEKAVRNNDSIGGVLETAVIGLPVGIGEPWFDTMEGVIAHAIFSVPAIKGVEFGAGFEFGNMPGSVANDEFRVENGKIITTTNNNGGINGGITNGMPIIFRSAVKPTPSITKLQNTVNFEIGENIELRIKGRHDPCIVHRARVVVDSITAFAVCDMLAQKFGTDWLVK